MKAPGSGAVKNRRKPTVNAAGEKENLTNIGDGKCAYKNSMILW
jgi:hypothetical protein